MTNQSEQAKLEILSDILGINESELCPEDKLNYHVPLLYVLEAMDKSVHSQPGSKQWVSVEDETPKLIDGEDYSENVLAIINGELGVACYCYHWEDQGENNGFYWANCYGKIDSDDCELDDDYDVTHWQHLPEPTNSTPTPKSDMVSKEKVIEILAQCPDEYIKVQECITKIKRDMKHTGVVKDIKVGSIRILFRTTYIRFIKQVDERIRHEWYQVR